MQIFFKPKDLIQHIKWIFYKKKRPEKTFETLYNLNSFMIADDGNYFLINS
jgi:hypothetical protein